MKLVYKTDKLTKRKIDRQIYREKKTIWIRTERDSNKKNEKRYECERWRLTLVGEETHTTHSKKEKIDKQTERERKTRREIMYQREKTRERDRDHR